MPHKTSSQQRYVYTGDHRKNLAKAIVMSLRLWSDERYHPFFLHPRNGKLDAEWFKWFVGEWKVARTIKKEGKEPVRIYFDGAFRNALRHGDSGEAVDAAAAHIRQRKWSAHNRNHRRGALPVSIVSKIGFFLCPDVLVPFDSYASRGMKELRKALGLSPCKGDTYAMYLASFNELYQMLEGPLRRGIRDSRVKALGAKMGCPMKALSTVAFRRKTFDHYLMLVAGYG